MTEQATLAELQRWAETDMRRLGLAYRVEVYWGMEPGGDGRGGMVSKDCQSFAFRQTAHAHTHEAKAGGPGAVARICVKRGGGRETIRHEVSHFVEGGDAHGPTFYKAMSRLGSASATKRLIADRRIRCPKHQWRTGRLIAERVTAQGLVRVSVAQCIRCSKRVGA